MFLPFWANELFSWCHSVVDFKMTEAHYLLMQCYIMFNLLLQIRLLWALKSTDFDGQLNRSIWMV